MHETLDKAEKMLCKVIDEISKIGNLDVAHIEIIGKVTDALKDIAEVRKHDGGSFERYSDYERRSRDSRGRFMDEGYHSEDYRRM